MGKKSGPTPPPSPDPVAISQAQSASNIATAEAQQRLNMVNTHGPTGSVTYAADPNAPGGYAQTTSLSPQEQALYDLQNKTELGATGIANDQLGRVQTALETPLDTAGLPPLRGGAGISMGGLGAGEGIRNTFDKGPALQYGYDPGQAIQGDVGGDLEAARRQAQDAAYGAATSRLDPRFATEESQRRARLANQGLSENSAAYVNAEDEAARAKNDAYTQAQRDAVTQGNTAANETFGRQVTQGQFHNAAAGQENTQNQGRAGFFNTTAGQDYGRNAGEATFANDAQNQGFGQRLSEAQLNLQREQAAAGLDNAGRSQGLQERAYVQNQPINQLTGLLGLGQVSMPQGISYTPSQVAPTDVLGANALKTSADNARYQAQAANSGGLMNGLFSLGAAAVTRSDIRLKRDIKLLRRRKDGVGVYSFRYRAGGGPQIGVMAQELRKVRPDLVVRGRDGYLSVNYAGLGAL